jgi:hypothetical protein
MKRRGIAALLGLLLLSTPAFAQDSFRLEPRVEPMPPEPDPDPAPFIAPPPDLYYVTDTYVADVVSHDGPLTTYSTSTVHESTGSYARVLETVATGEPSAYDGRAFNGRHTLSDGRAVAGTYYENYILTVDGFIPISIVFFQDDAELARILRGTPPPEVPASPRQPPSEVDAFVPVCCVAERPDAVAAPTSVPPTRPIRPGLSLLPLSSPLARLEVLRGRAVALWPRAFIDDREVPVRSWTVVSGQAGDAPATAGSGTVPFRTSWSRLAPPGAAYDAVLRIEVETPGIGHRTVDAAIVVVVRSPALEE